MVERKRYRDFRASIKREDRGTYAVTLYLAKQRTIRVGALGEFVFPRGWYVYIGRALNGLNARIARHRQREKKPFWHIDYLSRHAVVVAAETRVSRRSWECETARRVLAGPNARIIAPRFGASDCDCPTHLIYFQEYPPRVF